jgi:hypothetical protein
VEQPEGFEITGKVDCFCRLKLVLYGLEQAPRKCYLRVNKYFQDHGLIKNSSEPNLNILQSDKESLVVALPVDDRNNPE